MESGVITESRLVELMQLSADSRAKLEQRGRALWLRYCGPTRVTLIAIAAELGLSRERARQLLSSGIEYLVSTDAYAKFLSAGVSPEHPLMTALREYARK